MARHGAPGWRRLNSKFYFNDGFGHFFCLLAILNWSANSGPKQLSGVFARIGIHITDSSRRMNDCAGDAAVERICTKAVCSQLGKKTNYDQIQGTEKNRSGH